MTLATPQDAERRMREAIRTYGSGDVATLRIGPFGGTVQVSDGRRFPVRTATDAFAIARACRFRIVRVRYGR